MSLGYLTEQAAIAVLGGGTLPTAYYVQQHTDLPGLAFGDNIGPDTRRIGPLSFAGATNTVANTNSDSLVGAPADTDLNYLTLWDDPTAGACWWVVLLDGAPVAVTAGEEVGVEVGDLELVIDCWTQ